MGIAEDNDVIEAFPADRADQSLRMPVLPGCPWGRRVISDAHGSKTPGDRVAVGRVVVADEMVGGFVPWEGIGDLAGDPLRRWIGGNPERYQPPTKSSRKPTVGTMRKSMAAMPAAWL